MHKVVVTGGAGFIGSHLVDALVEKGYEVHVLDLVAQKDARFPNPRATYHQADIRIPKDLEPIFANATYVFHLAALPSVPYSIEHPHESFETNVTGTQNVLIAAKNAGVQKVIFSSSSAIYGDAEEMPVRENFAPQPKSPYALHKHIGEMQCHTWSSVYNLPTVSLRYFNVYGPRLNAQGPYASVIGKFLLERKKHAPLPITGTGKQTRDFVHVSDVARANILAAESAVATNGEACNIGSGKESSVVEIAQMIGGETMFVPARLEPQRSVADIAYAKKILGWIPSVSLQEGLNELLN